MISEVTQISAHSIEVKCMRPGPPYDTAKGHAQLLSPRDFKWKKLKIPLTAW